MTLESVETRDARHYELATLATGNIRRILVKIRLY